MNLHALTGAYVLDALGAEERVAFEAHLPGCPDCRAEVASLREAATTMAVADAVAPPPEMRDAVRARIARTPQLPPHVAADALAVATAPQPTVGQAPVVGRATPADATPPDAEAPTPPVPLRRRSRASWWASWPVTAAAAAVALVLAIGGTLLVQAQRTDRQTAALQAEVVRIVAAPDMVSHDLGLGGSHLVMSQEVGAAAVMGDDVPMPGHAGMVYQVWMMHTDGSMAAGPTFMPHDGEVTAVVEGDLSDVAAFMVTEEPKGGSPEPTGDYVAELHL